MSSYMHKGGVDKVGPIAVAIAERARRPDGQADIIPGMERSVDTLERAAKALTSYRVIAAVLAATIKAEPGGNGTELIVITLNSMAPTSTF